MKRCSVIVDAYILPLQIIYILLQCPQFQKNKSEMIERKATGTVTGIENSSKHQQLPCIKLNKGKGNWM